ncbi:hypothetical protein KP509_09G067200 [Ceratopteris richardii]|uniref:Uncharacterized protein n=1 Tax=Ceratopteris richardii TaxID=49495 RepID=A0A8T2U244_CERRI|nr:hypothetical protein KP509_09G067200 [Ceratopteris richardii]
MGSSCNSMHSFSSSNIGPRNLLYSIPFQSSHGPTLAMALTFFSKLQRRNKSIFLVTLQCKSSLHGGGVLTNRGIHIIHHLNIGWCHLMMTRFFPLLRSMMLTLNFLCNLRRDLLTCGDSPSPYTTHMANESC